MTKDLKELKTLIDKYILDNIQSKRSRTGKCNRIIPNSIPLDTYCYQYSRAPRKRKLDDVLNHLDDKFQKALFYFIDTKGLDEIEVYNKAHIDRRLFSKIRSNENFKPSKKTAICLCFGLELNLDEALGLLAKAGYTLSHSSRFDLIIEYFLKEEEYDLDMLNQVLYDYGEDILYI